MKINNLTMSKKQNLIEHYNSLLIFIIILITYASSVSSQEYNTLTNAKGSYTLIAPAKLRPNSNYHVSISLHPTSNESILFDLKVSISGDNQYHASNTSALLRPGETRILTFEIGSWRKGNKCQLTLVGKGKDTTIRNRADLEFEAKSCSIFIQTDKAIYKPGQTILFRLILVNSALLPVSNGTFDLYVLDPQKNRIKQWNQQRSINGIYSNEVKISTNPIFGEWTIIANYLGQEFQKTITIAEYVLPSFDVDLEIPTYATINQPIILTTIRAKYSFDKPVSNAEAELIILPKSHYYSSKIKPLTMLTIKKTLENGSISIPINLEKDLNLKVNQISNQEFDFLVKVEDTQTGKRINKTRVLKLFDKEIEIVPLMESKTFKPGLPINIQFKVAYQDNTPVENTNDVLVLKYGFGYNDEDLTKELSLVPRNGLAEATILTPKNISFNCVILEGKYRNQTYQFGCLESMQTFSQAYLQITSNDLTNGILPHIGQHINFIVNCTEKIDHLVYHVISRGDIVLSKSINFSGSKEREQSIYNLNFEITSSMSPKAKLIVYYIRPNNKEVIADMIRFNVDNVFKTPVKISLSDKKAKPNSLVKINVQTNSNAYVGLLAVDQSVNQIKGNNDITQEDVIKELETYDTVAKQTSWYGRVRRSLDQNSLITSSDVFSNSGLILLTDATIQNSAANSFYRMSNVNDLFYTSGLQYVPLSNGNIDLIDGVFNKEKSVEQNNFMIRKYFPETWIWASKEADYNGDAIFESRVPDSITSYTISAFAMDQQTGLGISPVNANLTVFRKFFVKLNLPYSIVRGEVISVQVLVFNYDSKPLESEITLFNDDRHFNFSTAISEQTDAQQLMNRAYAYKSRKVTVQPGASVPVSFLITSTKVGAINLRVKAISAIGGDSVIKTLLIKPEGETQYRNEARLIDLEKRNAFVERVNISLPSKPIAGSGFLQVSLVGDLIGTSLNNIKDLVRLPYGCGEQNMIKFVPNIIILEYLKNAKKLNPELEKKIINYIEIGYQTELKFRRADGSFSAFGDELDKEGSTWLTAFVLKSFLMAKPYLPIIDENVTNQAANWLIQRQVSDGSFDEPGEVHYKPLQGSSNQGQATLTAFVVIALYQKRELAQLYQGQINRAINYLSRQVQNDYAKSTHELAIITYALHLANADYKYHAFNKLWQLRYENRNQIFWPNNISNVVIKDRLNDKQSDHFYLPSPIDVETGAYGLLTLVYRSDIKQALPVMSWLISRQNSQGGFSSTQDTILALQALSQMASKMNSGHNVSAKVKFGYYKKVNQSVQPRQLKANRSEVLVDNQQKDEQFEIRLEARALELDQYELGEADLSYIEHSADKQDLWTKLNEKQEQTTIRNRRLVDKIPDYVEIEARGNGTAVFQVSWQYNLNTETEESPFYLETKVNSTIDQMNLNICSYYKVGNETNMAVLEVLLPSGWKMDNLESLMDNMDDTSKRIKKIESTKADTNIVFYFDTVKNDETCVKVPAQRTARIANNKPVAIKMYDYYNKVETSRLFYEPPKSNMCEICERSDCDISCGKGSFEESNEISNEYLKDPSSQACPLISSNIFLMFILILFILKKESYF